MADPGRNRPAFQAGPFVSSPQTARFSVFPDSPLLQPGDSLSGPRIAMAVLRLPGESNSDSFLNGERGFG